MKNRVRRRNHRQHIATVSRMSHCETRIAIAHFRQIALVPGQQIVDHSHPASSLREQRPHQAGANEIRRLQSQHISLPSIIPRLATAISDKPRQGNNGSIRRQHPNGSYQTPSGTGLDAMISPQHLAEKATSPVRRFC